MSEKKKELVTVTVTGAPTWLCGVVALPLFAALQQHRVSAWINGLYPDQFKFIGENWPKQLRENRDDLEVELRVNLPEKWQKEWPTEPGKWWFYGQRFGEGPAEHRLVTVQLDGSGHPVVTGNGHFWYRSENHAGVWQKANLPVPPAP